MAPINVLLIPGQAATREPYSIQPTVMNFTRILTATIDIQGLTTTGPGLAVLKRWGQNRFRRCRAGGRDRGRRAARERRSAPLAMAVT